RRTESRQACASGERRAQRAAVTRDNRLLGGGGGYRRCARAGVPGGHQTGAFDLRCGRGAAAVGELARARRTRTGEGAPRLRRSLPAATQGAGHRSVLRRRLRGRRTARGGGVALLAHLVSGVRERIALGDDRTA